MRILVLSFYYPPDLSAGSFRTASLVAELLKIRSYDIKIDVITTMPNRYFSHIRGLISHEHEMIGEKLEIHRIVLPKHKSGLLDQSIVFLKYALWVIKIILKKEKYDLVYATSSRLMTGFLGGYVSWRAKSFFYLDVRDIFYETIIELYGKSVFRVLAPIIKIIERLTIKQANHINLVSEGFLGYFHKDYPEKSFSFFTNGVDEQFISNKPLLSKNNKKEKINVLYAGNIGDGQALDRIIPEIANHFTNKMIFTIVGSGGRIKKLSDKIRDNNIANVILKSPIDRNDLIIEYENADVLFLHLNDLNAFKRVVPSKIFEYAALGKPIWAGVSGFSARFLREEIGNVAIFDPCDVGGAINAFKKLEIHTIDRGAFIRKYSRQSIMSKMSFDILNRFDEHRITFGVNV
jgi:hypothetical protein